MIKFLHFFYGKFKVAKLLRVDEKYDKRKMLSFSRIWVFVWAGLTDPCSWKWALKISCQKVMFFWYLIFKNIRNIKIYTKISDKLLERRFLVRFIATDTKTVIKMEDSFIPASRTRQPLDVSQPNLVWLLGMKRLRTATLASYQGLSINYVLIQNRSFK